MKSTGIGLGLRNPHLAQVLSGPVQVDWFEVIAENYMGLPGAGAGRALKNLEKVRERFPIVLHGVSLSLGSADPLNENYLRQLQSLIERIEPEWISDHLCWTSTGGHHLHDLLPLPYERKTLDYVSERIQRVQDFLGRRILVENVSSYLDYSQSEMSEWEFLSEITRKTGCQLLLDVNNIYVSSVNHGFDAQEFLHGIPLGCVSQIHLAGHSKGAHCLIDTHDQPVCDEVWQLYRQAVLRWGAVPTMIEWDAEIPEYTVLEAEALRARKLQEETLASTQTQSSVVEKPGFEKSGVSRSDSSAERTQRASTPIQNTAF